MLIDFNLGVNIENIYIELNFSSNAKKEERKFFEKLNL